MAVPRSSGSSRQPPLTLSVAGCPVLRCHRREPQSGQNAQSRTCPEAVRRDHSRGEPCSSRSAVRGIVKEIPKAEEDCFRHSVQWQTYTISGDAGTAKRTLPHWHPPVCPSGRAAAVSAMTCIGQVEPQPQVSIAEKRPTKRLRLRAGGPGHWPAGGCQSSTLLPSGSMTQANLPYSESSIFSRTLQPSSRRAATSACRSSTR